MNIYIDFDGTLFDTKSFYQDFIKICELFNVNKSNIDELKKKKLFNLDDFALEIKTKYHLPIEFLNKVDKLYDKKYLYNDSVRFLENYYTKYNLYLLTFGDEKYQQKKITCCNITKYFKDIIITTDKSKEKIDYINSWFIDNNPVEIEKIFKVGAQKIIRIKRSNDKYRLLSCTVHVLEYFDLDSIDVL